ncbi:glycosyl transferase family 1 [Bacterioplanes sanyensis]|uniref:tRNA-queuosine alpha-mannosyltransferase domain-containing protein n=1 Tax=Bacterioplanes sanyensis TaxID=1249553 RepID=UPI0016757F0E|nr:DUF3524 domain-containing protein [Bacterioplanes sanyensis]GGY35189.1 glycosyl transferase family 1 [Bacterioplanes sanyensis]
MKSILMLSAYRSDSHAQWADGLQRQLQADWRVFELPGRYFRWRIRGNPLSWLQPLQTLLQGWQPDHVLATSMVDLATLRGLLPQLAAVPASYYFHENQFAYPVSQQQHASVDPQMVQLYGALAAQQLLFNSAYNRDSFLQGLAALLKRLPDQVPLGVVEQLQQRSQILPVMVEPVAISPRAASSLPLVLWNHRWEYDKRPDRFLALLRQLHQPVRLALLGSRPQQVPAALMAIRQEFSDWIVVDDFPPRDEYLRWLQQADVAVSCADHEFQGLAMLEAVSAGAKPLVPDALCYREQYPPQCRYIAGDMQAAAAKLQNWQQLPAADIGAWLAPAVKARWQSWLGKISNGGLA